MGNNASDCAKEHSKNIPTAKTANYSNYSSFYNDISEC